MAAVVELGEKRWVHLYVEDWPTGMKQGAGSSWLTKKVVPLWIGLKHGTS